MKRTVFTILMALAVPAIAQQAPQAPAEPKQEPEKQRRPLNLRLDNPGSFATENPAKAPAKDLPALGGDARKPAAAPEGIGIGRSDSPVYPKDTNPTR